MLDKNEGYVNLHWADAILLMQPPLVTLSLLSFAPLSDFPSFLVTETPKIN